MIGLIERTSFLTMGEEIYLGYRKFIEDLWVRYAPYCPDSHFASEIRRQFHQRTWEMYLACALLDSGHQLRKTMPFGPDLCIAGDPPTWVEAVAVEPGDSADRVLNEVERRDTSIRQGEGVWIGDPPSEKSLILRCTQAMTKKIAQVKKYKRRAIISKTDPVIVAISLGKIDGASYFASPKGATVFIKAFFGISNEYVAYTPNSGKGFRHGYLDRPAIFKQSGKPVSTRQFLGKDATDISGVLGSCIDIFNVNHMPSDILLVKNPMAVYPYKPGSIHCGSEYQAEGGFIKPYKRQ